MRRLISDISTGLAVLIFVALVLCIRRCFRKRRTKEGKKGVKGAVDLKSVQLLGNAYKEKVRRDFACKISPWYLISCMQVQPDMEELTENVEEPEEVEEKAPIQKLGKLQYRVSQPVLSLLLSFIHILYVGGLY